MDPTESKEQKATREHLLCPWEEMSNSRSMLRTICLHLFVSFKRWTTSYQWAPTTSECQACWIVSQTCETLMQHKIGTFAPTKTSPSPAPRKVKMLLVWMTFLADSFSATSGCPQPMGGCASNPCPTLRKHNPYGHVTKRLPCSLPMLQWLMTWSVGRSKPTKQRWNSLKISLAISDLHHISLHAQRVPGWKEWKWTEAWSIWDAWKWTSRILGSIWDAFCFWWFVEGVLLVGILRKNVVVFDFRKS